MSLPKKFKTEREQNMNIPSTGEWNFTDVKFLPILKEYAKRINLVETINTMTDPPFFFAALALDRTNFKIACEEDR